MQNPSRNTVPFSMLMSAYLQAFYESLPDLVAIIPSILYKESKEEAEAEKRKGEKEEKKRKEADVDDFEEDLQPDEEEVEEVNLEEDEDLQEAINLSNRMVFDAFLGRVSYYPRIICFSWV